MDEDYDYDRYEDDGEPYDECPTCQGSGTVDPLTAPKGFFCTGLTECPDCNGLGSV